MFINSKAKSKNWDYFKGLKVSHNEYRNDKAVALLCAQAWLTLLFHNLV
jgi:hypothetical protein